MNYLSEAQRKGKRQEKSDQTFFTVTTNVRVHDTPGIPAVSTV